MYDLIGAADPDAAAAYGDPEDEYVVCKDGMYYIWENDIQYPLFYLSAYQYLGDDMFYLSFDADDRWMAGYSWNLKGIVSDYCRLVVKRSDSEWGFTVVSKLMSQGWSILPRDFPPPKHSISYEPKPLLF